MIETIFKLKIIFFRYLASGDEIRTFSVAHRISEATVREIITKTCVAIVEALGKVYVSPPNRVAWRNIAAGFRDVWNLPNCIGAIDGKHISITAPNNSGSLYFNYKKFFSIVLLATCDHNYQFTQVDIGAYGSESDGGVFSRSRFGQDLIAGKLNIPEETPFLPGSNVATPYFFVGENAFKMSKNMLRPFSGKQLSDEQRIYNYRLSRARRCIENAFGILAARWRVLNNRIGFQPEYVKSIVMAAVCLHNFLMSQTQSVVREKYCPEKFTDQVNDDGELVYGEWRNEVPGNNGLLNENCGDIHPVKEATNIRDAMNQFFNSPAGEVP